MIRIAFVCALALGSALPALARRDATADELARRIAREQVEMKRLREELERGRRSLTILHSEARNARATLERIDSNLALGTRILERKDSALRLQRLLSNRARRELDEARSSADLHRRALAQRVRRMHIEGRPDPSLAWLDGGDALAWDRRRQGWKAMIENDRRLLRQVINRRRQVESAIDRHRRSERELLTLLDSKRFELASTGLARKQREIIARDLQTRADQERARLRELEASQRVLAGLLERLEQRRREAALRQKQRPAPQAPATRPGTPAPPHAPTLRTTPPPGTGPRPGTLCPPARGEILSRFGIQVHPTLGTRTRNLGVEIGGRPPLQVKAAASGRVAAVTRLPGRGNTLILEHPDGFFTIYGNLRRIDVAEGREVLACEAVALAANTADEGGLLYFEVRRGLEALDPLSWLKEAP